MEYWLSSHNEVVGVAGSNPVVPTFFRPDYLILQSLNYLDLPALVGFFFKNMEGRLGYA